jgi:pentatricopeptide repeat protein
MLRICLDHKQYSKLEMYWLEHKQLKLLPDEESLTIMFHGYSRQGLFVKAIEVMEKIAKPTLQTWESFLLYLIGREILTKESMQLLDRLRTMGELGKRYGLIQQLEEHRNQVKTFVKKAVPSIHSLLAEHKDLFLK